MWIARTSALFVLLAAVALMPSTAAAQLPEAPVPPPLRLPRHVRLPAPVAERLLHASDADTPTGKRLNLNRASMPANRAGVPIDPTDMNRADGFSPGNLIVTHVPGMDNQEAFDADRRRDRRRHRPLRRRQGQPVVVINADTRKRHLIWAELDVNAASPRTRT